jgi:hypothetical protein
MLHYLVPLWRCTKFQHAWLLFSWNVIRRQTVSFLMEPSTQYREFAEECRRFAQLAKTDEQRKILLQMEMVWTKLAEEAEGRAAESQD